MAEEIRYDADEANQVSARLIADSIAADNPVNAVFGGLRVSGGVNLEFTRGINSFLKGSIDVITDFRGIHDMKNIAAVGTRRTVWDTMNIGQHFLAYANATYDTLNTAKVVKPFVNPTADGGLQWKHSPQDYFKTLVPDPDQLWNFKTIHQAPGKLHDGSIDVVNAIRVGISDL